MGSTIIEKIIRNNIGKEVHSGDIVTVNVDRVMIHDIFIPFVASKFEEMGFTKIWDADKAVLIYDHLVPASQVDDTRHFCIVLFLIIFSIIVEPIFTPVPFLIQPIQFSHCFY